ILRLLSWLVLYFVFFFQAEDGIRDGHVTGVQTCALPIWRIILPAGQRHVLGAGEQLPDVDAAQRGRHHAEVRQRREAPADFGIEIGRASCRERVEMSGGGVSLKKKDNRIMHTRRTKDTWC